MGSMGGASVNENLLIDQRCCLDRCFVRQAKNHCIGLADDCLLGCMILAPLFVDTDDSNVGMPVEAITDLETSRAILTIDKDVEHVG